MTKKESQATNNRIGDIVKRLTDLEQKPTGDKANGATTATTSSTTWQPQHMIFGWPAEMDRDKLLEEMRVWLQDLPAELRNLLLHPYAPRKRTSIAKIKVEPGSISRVSWRLQQRLQEQGVRDGRSGPTWCATERSPEQGAHRRRTKIAANNLQKWNELIELEMSNGDVTSKAGMVLARLNRASATWTPSFAWQSFATAHNLDRNEIHAAMRRD